MPDTTTTKMKSPIIFVIVVLFFLFLIAGIAGLYFAKSFNLPVSLPIKLPGIVSLSGVTPRATENDFSFIEELSNNVISKKADLDKIIEKAAPDWPLDKISVVDRNILRIGLCELLFGDRKEVPPKVAINEAIELAKTFGGTDGHKYVNGVLNKLGKALRPNELDQRNSTNMAVTPS